MGFWPKIIGAGVGILLLIGACIYLYQQGKNHGISIANDRISRYEEKIKDQNLQLAKKEILVRERVLTEYHTNTIIKTKIEYKNRDVIQTAVPEQFKLSQGWIYAHDQSALGIKIDPTQASNPAPSTVSDRSALIGVTENYNKFNRSADQMEALQRYIRLVGIPITNETTTPSN